MSSRVAHVFPSHSWGGAEMYCLQLAQAQKAEGTDVVVWGAADTPLVDEARKLGLAVLVDALSYRANVTGLPKAVAAIRREKITHLHLHWSGGVWAFLGVKLFVPVKIILHAHLWIKHTKMDPLHWTVYSAVDAIIVAGERAQKAAQRLLPVSRRKVHIVPYAMDFSAAVGVKSRRNDLRIPESAFVFGVFARLDFQKGQKEFLLALKDVQKSYPECWGLIVGDPTIGEEASLGYAREINALIEASSYKDRIVQMGFQKDFWGFLHSCDVLVAPSYHESYSLIFLNAFALGKPALGTDAGGTPDIVIPGETGWLAKPKDVSSLKNLMMEIISKKSDVRSLGASANEKVHSRHSFKAVSELLREIY